MGSMARVCLQSVLKLMNSLLGVVGMGMILYALWMLRIWYKETGGLWSNPNPPWFIYSFLAYGVVLCLVTCCGHVAAETANGHCLSCYSMFVIFLIALEGALTADLFLNGHWEQDFPPDPTGRLDEFKDFVKSNLEACKWIGFSVIGMQVLAIFISGILKALGPDHGHNYESDDDDDYTPVRLPLLVNQSQPTYAAGVPIIKPYSPGSSDSWNVRINQS